MRDYMIASAIFAQGQPEDFHKSILLIEDLAKKGKPPKLVDPEEVPDQALVCQVLQRAGGGFEYKEGELEALLGPFQETYAQRDWECFSKSLRKTIPEIEKATLEEVYGYMTFCTSSSQGIVPMYLSALDGKPVIDGDCCGTAMRPHLDEVAGIKYKPIQVYVSPFGEIVVVKDTPASRARLILENLHRMSGCWFLAWAFGVTVFKEYKKAMVKNQTSKMIRIGGIVRKAREHNENPITAFMKAAPAYKLFEGEVESFSLKKTGGYAHGDFYIRGGNTFKGHQFRVWYSMENRISWLDGQPYVTIPDINAIVDSVTCECISVLDHNGLHITNGMYNGRNVTVFGITADRVWYEIPGAIEAVNAQLRSYGFDIKHRPINEIVSNN
jgi:DUF917 family protein